MKKRLGSEEITWDLTPFYKDIHDERINHDIKQITIDISSFSSKFNGKIKKTNLKSFNLLVSELEEILQKISRINSFAYLNYVTQSNNAEAGAFFQRILENSSIWQKDLVFFDLEWAKLDNHQAELILRQTNIRKYRHYLKKTRKYKPHLLSKREERLLAEIEPVGVNSWIKLFDKTISQKKFGKKQRAEEEVLSDLYHPNRKVRITAAEEFTEGLNSQLHILTHIFNTILADKMIKDRLRHYPDWISSMNLDNEIDEKIVEALIHSVKSRYDIPQRYYRMKKELLSYENLYDYDRYAPLPVSSTEMVTWVGAKKTVLKAYSNFSPNVGKIVKQFFEKRWIHAPISIGKRGGAFADPCTPDVHPYILVNYSGTFRNVQTLAHELGHGVHQYLSGKHQGYFNSQVPLPMAETASVFGEMLVFQELLNNLKNQEEKLSLLCNKMEEIFATVFRQTAMNQFENVVHNERRKHGELSSEHFGEAWISTQKEMFGTSVTLTDNYKIWWSYIPHFLHTPGYVYSYAYGELLALSLYEKYLEEGEPFVKKYLDLLSSGGKDTPSKLLENLNINIEDLNFWMKGLNIINELLNQTEEFV
jgi:oligoendopeptidase F